MKEKSNHSFSGGLRDGLPIGLGYLSVSFAFGIFAVKSGLPIWAAIAISMTNLTSAGQMAGVPLIVAAASYMELMLAQLIINIRYSLMSLSLSQKLEKSVGVLGRLGISFGITDEVFAVASTKDGKVGTTYMRGLIFIPYIGWTLGTVIGAVAGSLLPASVQSALGIAIYGMFIAIIVPAAKKSFSVFAVVLMAVILSCLFKWVPGLNMVSDGFVIIICAVLSAGIGAVLFPVKDEEVSA